MKIKKSESGDLSFERHIKFYDELQKQYVLKAEKILLLNLRLIVSELILTVCTTFTNDTLNINRRQW